MQYDLTAVGVQTLNGSESHEGYLSTSDGSCTEVFDPCCDQDQCYKNQIKLKDDPHALLVPSEDDGRNTSESSDAFHHEPFDMLANPSLHCALDGCPSLPPFGEEHALSSSWICQTLWVPSLTTSDQLVPMHSLSHPAPPLSETGTTMEHVSLESSTHWDLQVINASEGNGTMDALRQLSCSWGAAEWMHGPCAPSMTAVPVSDENEMFLASVDHHLRSSKNAAEDMLDSPIAYVTHALPTPPDDEYCHSPPTCLIEVKQEERLERCIVMEDDSDGHSYGEQAQGISDVEEDVYDDQDIISMDLVHGEDDDEYDPSEDSSDTEDEDDDDGDDDDGGDEDHRVNYLPRRGRYSRSTMIDRTNNAPKSRPLLPRQHSVNRAFQGLNYSQSEPRRTITSYDPQTTHFLKTIFFETYGNDRRLTKAQRRLIIERTGLKPRNITYWFSNHKRRFRQALEIFRCAVRESNGKVRTYEDFLSWNHQKSQKQTSSQDDKEDGSRVIGGVQNSYEEGEEN